MQEYAFKLRGKTRAAFLNPDRRLSTSMFMKRDRKLEFVKSGTLFYRPKANNSVETARVLGMQSDAFGITHIRYEVSIMRRHLASSYFEGPRTLALKAFTEKYWNRTPTD